MVATAGFALSLQSVNISLIYEISCYQDLSLNYCRAEEFLEAICDRVIPNFTWPVAKEQVQSLGASYVMVEDAETAMAETAGGYAREMSEEYQAKQAALIADTITKQDIVICTALIPGRPAPLLLNDAHVRSMRPGSVIVDLAVENGGNCALSEMGRVVEVNGVKIIGHANFPSRLAVDASNLYARNLFNFLSPHIDGENATLSFDFEDETVSGVCLTRGGAVIHPILNAKE